MTNAICMPFLRRLILSGILFCTLLIPSFQSTLLATEQKITIVNKEQSDPPWKQRWDRARDLFEQGRFNDAVEQYRKVIEEKPHIEEVRWELSKTYMGARSYSEALVLIEELIEAAPDNMEYLVSGGEVALKLGRADQAATLFGRALALEPDGALSVRTLSGMIDSLKAQQKIALAIPLMEQIYRSGKRSPELLTELARFYASNGNARRAAYFYRELLTKFRVQTGLLFEAAEAFDKAGQFDEAAQQREAALKRDPFQIEARIELADYYQNRGQADKALPHLLEILKSNYRRDHYL
ncbi:MAG: tetratricopeptide repeat protein, partial [Desulfofustis sp.]